MEAVLKIIDLGRMGYQEALEVQRKTLEQRIQGLIPDTLLFVEHQPVYTVGRGWTKDKPAPSHVMVPNKGQIPVYSVERGGQMTFHGPGQLVGYPIIALSHKDIRKYLRDLERVLIRGISTTFPGIELRPCPANLELEAGQLETGVWVGDQKISSIGIAVKQWVSYHGFAINLNPELAYFSAIEPCGFQGEILTSLAELTHEQNTAKLQEKLTELKQNIGELCSKMVDQMTQAALAEDENSSDASVSAVTAPLTLLDGEFQTSRSWQIAQK